MEGERHGLVAGLAVALGGGILFIVLLALFLGGLGDSDSSTTVTVTAAAAPSTTGDAGATGTATTTGTTAASLAPDVVAGASTFRAFACGACHGLSGQGGV